VKKGKYDNSLGLRTLMWDGQSEFSRKLEQYAVFNAGEVNLADTAQTLREE